MRCGPAPGRLKDTEAAPVAKVSSDASRAERRDPGPESVAWVTSNCSGGTSVVVGADVPVSDVLPSASVAVARMRPRPRLLGQHKAKGGVSALSVTTALPR